MSRPRSDLAKVLRANRKRLGLSGRELGRKVRLSAQALCDVEYGRRGVSPEAAVRLAKALGLPEKEVLWLAADYRLARFKTLLKKYEDHLL